MVEPKQETLQISSSQEPRQPGSATDVAKPDTRRIVPPTPSIRRLPPKITPHQAEATGPKKETARVNIVARPAPTTPVLVTSRPVVASETIPRPLCWALAGISVAIFLIQIWNYVVS